MNFAQEHPQHFRLMFGMAGVNRSLPRLVSSGETTLQLLRQSLRTAWIEKHGSEPEPVLLEQRTVLFDGLARQHHMIAIDYRGTGLSGGTSQLTIDAMARDTVELIRALGYKQVDLIGFSMGGFVAQDVASKVPGLVRRLVVASTGPAGGKGIDRIGALSWPLILKGLLTLRDPKASMFFTSTLNGRHAARDYLMRVKERTVARDKGPTPRLLFRQLKAIKAWGKQPPQDLARLRIPVLIAAGDSDIIVASELSRDMARRIPLAQLVVYADAGHGGVFQYHADFVSKVLEFLN